MGAMNFRAAYQVDPETDDSQYSGGLLGRLQAMLQQGQGDEYFQPGTDSGSTPDGANSDGNPQGGLLGRLLALQAEQSPYRPLAGSDGQTPSEPRDPNFRRLAGVYITDPKQDGIDLDRSGSYLRQTNGETSQPSPSYASIPAVRLVSRNSNLSPEPQNPAALANWTAALAGFGPQNPTQTAPQAGGGLWGAYSDKPGPPSIAGSPMMKTAQGIAIPIPRPVSVPLPPIPMPIIPDWWKAAGMILQMYRSSRSGRGGGGNDRDECDERLGAEMSRCYARKQEYAHPDFLHGCTDRAKDRWGLCVKNGRQFPPSEPPEWGPDDEEVWFNHNR